MIKSANSPTHAVEDIGNFIIILIKCTRNATNGPYVNPAIKVGISEKLNSKKLGNKNGKGNLKKGTTYKIVDNAPNTPQTAIFLVLFIQSTPILKYYYILKIFKTYRAFFNYYSVVYFSLMYCINIFCILYPNLVNAKKPADPLPSQK